MSDEHDDVTEARWVVRPREDADSEAIALLQRRGLAIVVPWSAAQLAHHVATFPEGQIVIEVDGELVASSSALVLSAEEDKDERSLEEIARGGFFDHHDPSGDVLFAMDLCGWPYARGTRLTRRLCEARQELAKRLGLRKVVLAGCIPGFAAYADVMDVAEYVRRVVRQELIDPVITAQLSSGFTIRAVLDDLLPSEPASTGHAVLMEWLNHAYAPASRPRACSRVRVASVQYQMRPVSSFEDFAKQTEFFVETANEYRVDFLLFPELLTTQLLGLVGRGGPGEGVRRLHELTERYVEHFGKLAIRHRVNVIAGTHLTVEDGKLYNIAYLFHRDGRIDRQYKIHVTPNEKESWGVEGGDRQEVFDTDRGKIAISICYDTEFPEQARIAKARGAQLLFVPYNTDLRSGHVRVRACAQARCIENHLYAVLSGACGNLPEVDGVDIHWAQSCILTPSDVPFARDGVAAEATANVETMLVQELDLELLRRTERTGAVRTWGDRRRDLYSVVWRDEKV